MTETNYNKGPKLNNISRNFTTRDSLGIESVAASMQGDMCPIVNTVTPRPFYWAFIMWAYYDYYASCVASERNNEGAKYNIRKHNYFLALGSVLAEENVVNGFIGSETLRRKPDIYEQMYFDYEEHYITRLSTMTYYPAGLYTMDLLVEEDPKTHEKFKYPHITPAGEKLALAFDKVFSKTQYYKKYKDIDEKVPKDVLIELGKKVLINLEGFDEVKAILIEYLFHKQKNIELLLCCDYVNQINKDFKMDYVDSSFFRKVLFDYYPNEIKHKNELSYLKEKIDAWEIMVGRQYFTIGLEMIWKFMLECLNTPKSQLKWFTDCLNASKFSVDISLNCEEILGSCNYSFEERENIVSEARSDATNHDYSIDNGMKIIFSIYNRLFDRKDYSKTNMELYNYGEDRDAISLRQFISTIEEYKKKNLKDLIIYIMDEFLLKQHIRTAITKMLRGNDGEEDLKKKGKDGFYIEKIGDLYSRKADFKIEYQGIRLVQLTSVMRDLGIIGD